MAYNIGKNKFPEGKWDTSNEQTHFWMIYKKFYYFDDASGSEFIEMQKTIREAISTVRKQLEEHQIDIINVATQQFLEPTLHGHCLGVAVAFKSKEDLVMAKMLVECDGVYGL